MPSAKKPAAKRARRPAQGPLRKALEEQLRAVDAGPEVAAVVAGCQGLAALLDKVPDEKLWREYRLYLGLLMESTADAGEDSWDQFLEGLRAEVVDPENPVP